MFYRRNGKDFTSLQSYLGYGSTDSLFSKATLVGPRHVFMLTVSA